MGSAPAGVGYLCVAIAVFGFGSNFVPVKRFETGDGMFYQWMMCSAIFIFGLVLQLALFFHPFESDLPNTHETGDEHLIAKPDSFSVKFFPFTILGGALWATGNTMAVPVINWIGLSMGLLIWGCTNMLMVWASGRFGILIKAEDDELQDRNLNSFGVALVVVALFLFTFVKPNMKPEQGDEGLLQLPPALEATQEKGTAPLSNRVKRVAGVVLAMISGVLYATTFTPNTIMIQKGEGPVQPLDYVFSHFTGIYAASTFWFVVYCVVMRSSPRLYPRLVLPSLASGLMWAVAQTCWFVANDSLSFSVAFPLVTSGPGLIGAAWGVFVFSEIRGRRNYIFLAIALSLTIAGCTCIGISGPKDGVSPPSPPPFAP